MEELKNIIHDIGQAFEQFKAENDARIKALETKGNADPLLIEKIEKINVDISAMTAMKKQLEAIETAVARQQFSGGGSSKTPAMAEYKAAWTKWFKSGISDGLKELAIRAEVSTLSDPDGGFFTAPPEVDAAVDRIAVTMSAMRRICSVMSIGADTYKKFVGQGGNAHGWVGEKENRTETDTPTLREIVINVQEIYSMPATTQILLDDAIKDIAAWLSDEVSVDFAEAEGVGFVSTGTGVKSPKSLNAYTKVANASYTWGSLGYIAGAHATLLNNMDKLIDLQHALKPIYRAGASWLMNDATVAKLRVFKDGDGNYIWRPGLLEGAPDILLGKPIEIDDNVDDVGAGKYPIYYGNFKRGYLIIDRQGIRVIRDNLTEKGKVLFYTTKRVGGGVVMYEAIKCLKIAAS